MGLAALPTQILNATDVEEGLTILEGWTARPESLTLCALRGIRRKCQRSSGDQTGWPAIVSTAAHGVQDANTSHRAAVASLAFMMRL